MNDEVFFGTTVPSSTCRATSWKTEPLPRPGEDPRDRARTWPRSTQLAAAFLVVALSLAMGWQVYSRSADATRPTRLLEGYRLDLNRADAAQLSTLPGVGEVLADRIVRHRLEHGEFRSVEDLRDVKGIGEAKLVRLRERLYVDPDRQQSGAPPAVVKSGSRKVPHAVNVNTASAFQLQNALPGIGPTLAARIVEARKARPFTSADDLARVHGIGKATVEKVRPYVLVREE